MRGARAALVALLVASGANAFAAKFAGVDVPSPLPAKLVSDTHWGVVVEDPYRFLEDTSDPAVQQWMRAQSEATSAILARIPGREPLIKRLQDIDAAVPAVIGNVSRDRRGRLFYMKRNADENQFKLYRRDSSGDKLLVDAEAIGKAAGKPHAINEFRSSPDGSRLAYAMSASGSEIGTLHVIDTSTGAEVAPPIDRIRGADVTWLPDNSGFFYSRLAADYATRPRAERFLDQIKYFRTLANSNDDRAIFGPGVNASVTLERGDHATIVPVTGKPIVFVAVTHGVQREFSLYRATLADAMAKKDRWAKVFDPSAQVQDMAIGGAWLYLKTARDAPRFAVLRTSLERPDVAKATTLIPESGQVITNISGAKDGLYVTRRDGAVKRLYRVSHASGPTMSAVALPIEGNLRVASADPEQTGVLLAIGGWTRATRHYALDTRGQIVDVDLAPKGPFDAPDLIEAREVRVKSHDGVEVPVSILMAKGTQLDGRNPALLYGYGAYGNVEEPTLAPRILAWLERGGVYAIAHVRGGGVFGDAWRRAGWKTTKPNTWKDGIAAAEWLIANGYTSKDRLGVYGGSAGGIFVGRAITERPDLFAAAVIAVGNVDSVRSETRANGAANVPEYGTVTREDEFKGLLAMSPYANVKQGAAYPAVLFEHGVNDNRVDVWMSTKLASRLAASTTSDAPVLLRLDYDAGHGIGNTRDQQQQQIADRWTFLLWRAGVKEFQATEQ